MQYYINKDDLQYFVYDGISSADFNIIITKTNQLSSPERNIEIVEIDGRNNNLLRDSRNKVSPKVYDLLIDLVNENREDLAEMALKIDYLIEYANSAIKGKDFSEALETVQRAEERLKMIKRSNFDVSHLEYLIEGVKKKIRK